jgi:hypothetical protein
LIDVKPIDLFSLAIGGEGLDAALGMEKRIAA